MNYEYILIFWFFTVCLTSLSLITLTLKKRKHPAKQLLLSARCKPLLLPSPSYNYSIEKHLLANYDYSYLKAWLYIHLHKYPNGILPLLPVSFGYTDDHAKHTFNFYDGTTDKNQKYIKQMFTILKPLKKLQSTIDDAKPFDVVKQAEAVVSSVKPKRTYKKRTTGTKKAIIATGV